MDYGKTGNKKFLPKLPINPRVSPEKYKDSRDEKEEKDNNDSTGVLFNFFRKFRSLIKYCYICISYKNTTTMNIIFKYRMLSDESDNFVRDFEVYPDMTLTEFHRFILRALGYDECMVSIFKSDADWQLVEEFSEIDMGDDIPGAPRCMDKVRLMEVTSDFHDRIIYTFDMINDRSFYLELVDMQRPQAGLSYPRVAFEHAQVPDQYNPEATVQSGSIFDEMMSEYNEFDGDDNYDDEF